VKSEKSNSTGVWEITDTACLLRNKHSRKYYGRFTLWGKQKWVNLKTDVLTVAKLRLPDEVKRVEALRALGPAVLAGRATMEHLMKFYENRTRANPDLKPSSIVSRITALKKIRKTWPDIGKLKPGQVTPEKVKAWADRFKEDGTQFRVPNSKTVRKGNSATSVNRAIDTLRRILDIALASGQIHTNPVSVKPGEGRLKKKITRKKLVLPSEAEAERLIKSMRESGSHGGWGVEASFLCRFLMATGARIGEIPLTKWRNVNREENTLYLPGYKTEASERYLPLFPQLPPLLREITEWRKAVASRRKDRRDFLAPTDSIFRIKECQKTIDAACIAVGVARLTHHDFRHLFATLCMEQKVPAPIVAGWLGHADGGVLVMNTYAHVRPDVSQEFAKGLKFGNFS